MDASDVYGVALLVAVAFAAVVVVQESAVVDQPAVHPVPVVSATDCRNNNAPSPHALAL